MSCGDKCKCDCCKAKKKAAAAAKRRTKAKSSTAAAGHSRRDRGTIAAPLIMIHNPKSNELPRLNVSNHPSTMPKNGTSATQTTTPSRVTMATQTDTPSRVTMATQTDALTRPLPELPRLRENVTRPLYPQRRTATAAQQDETLPYYGFTTRTGRLATVRITEPQATARGFNRLSSLFAAPRRQPVAPSAATVAPSAATAPPVAQQQGRAATDGTIHRLITNWNMVENTPNQTLR